MSRDFIAKRVATLKPSGIRKFFDIVATMDDVISSWKQVSRRSGMEKLTIPQMPGFMSCGRQLQIYWRKNIKSPTILRMKWWYPSGYPRRSIWP